MGQRKPDKFFSGVTLRAVLIALILIPFNNYWIFMMEIVRYAGHPTTISLFYNAIFLLLLLLGANALIRLTAPKWVFSQGELLTVYIMVNIASALAGHDMIQVLVPGMTHAFRFATPENNWADMFLGHLPQWLTVQDPDVLAGFYQGASSFYERENIIAWGKPVMMWSLFIMALVFVMLCLTVLLRKQWTEREKLTYPLVHLPLDMTSDKEPFFKNRLLWGGMAVAFGISIIQGFSVLFPSIPGLQITGINLNHHLTTRPWNAIGNTPISFYPFAIGLGVLLPLDLSFSTWFFFLFWKAQFIISASLGWDQIPQFPYVTEQSFGAYIGIFVFAVWAGRKHIKNITSGLFSSADLDDSGEPVRYRTAIAGAVIGTLFLMFFLRAMGLSWWLVVAFFAIYFALSIAVTRMRAELGPPAHDLHRGGPDSMLPVLVGPQRLGTQNLVGLSLLFWFNRAYRSHPMPFQLEGFKMAERANMNYRKLFIAIILAAIAGTIASFWSQLHILYQVGSASKVAPPTVPLVFGGEPYHRLDGWLRGATPPNANIGYAMGVGFGFTMILNVLRMRMFWFPFHPVGYAISSSWSMQQLWMCLFIAWLIKLVLLRYGGLRLYRKAVPFFLGIVLGECIMGSLWTIIGIALNIQTYAFWP